MGEDCNPATHTYLVNPIFIYTIMKLVTRWTKRKEIAAKRLQICQECDQLELDTYRCKKCGCFMKYKTELPFAKCPLDKWIQYEETIGDD